MTKKTMTKLHTLLFIFLSSFMFGCASDGSINTQAVMNLSSGILQATTLDENSVKQTASLAAREMDNNTRVASTNSAYVQRLSKITRGLKNYDGLNLNFKVYLTKEINAFAMADGTVRIHAGLLDAMNDAQVRAVIAHEMGHVKLKHSYKQMKEIILTNTAFKTAASLGGKVGALTSSQLGQLAQTAANSHFSQSDELEADQFAVKALKKLGHDPYDMKRAIETLQKNFGDGGGFLSSHPANSTRISGIIKALENL